MINHSYSLHKGATPGVVPSGTPGTAGVPVSMRGRPLHKPAKFSPSKLPTGVAVKRRLMNQHDVSPVTTEGENKGTGTKNTKKKQKRSTGGMQPKNHKDILKAERQARGKKSDSESTVSEGEEGEGEEEEEDEEEDEEAEEEEEEEEEEVIEEEEQEEPKTLRSSTFKGKGTAGQEAPASKPNKEPFRKKVTRERSASVNSDAESAQESDYSSKQTSKNLFGLVPKSRHGKQTSTVNVAQIAAHFDGMDRLRAIIRGKDPVPPVPGPPDEKLSLRDMFTLFTDFARAVRDPVPPPAPAPAPLPPMPAPPAPAQPPPEPVAPAPVPATPLTLDNFERLMKAFQQNIK